jgi:hypothetical protein
VALCYVRNRVLLSSIANRSLMLLGLGVYMKLHYTCNLYDVQSQAGPMLRDLCYDRRPDAYYTYVRTLHLS